MINLVFMLLPMPISSGGSIVGEKLTILLKRFDTVVFGDEKTVNIKSKNRSKVKVSHYFLVISFNTVNVVQIIKATNSRLYVWGSN